MDNDDLIDDENSEPFAWATFHNVPVHVTLMEHCDGTFYQLCMTHSETEKHRAWMTQIVFALAFAQHHFGFVHNDLHANNVMYVKTEQEFLYYNLNGTFYRVPTYGFLIKLIDFERGTGSVKITGMKDPKFFMSDHFMPSEEAGGQYNFEPYYIPKFPIIKPNPSFDLARFATSIFWDLFQEGPEHEKYQTNPLFQWFMKWMKYRRWKVNLIPE
jgi:serine/threonine protein kinase